MKRYRPHTLHPLTGDRDKVQVVYEEHQPARDFIAAQIWFGLDRLTYKPWPKPWVRTSWRLVDRLGGWWHVRRTGCNNDCGTWYQRLSTDPPTGMFVMDEAHAIPGCQHMPPSAEWDCFIYSKTEKNKTYATTFVDEDVAGDWRGRNREDRTGG